MTGQQEQHPSLVAAAVLARVNAYAPYSGFKVGAAILADDGRLFTGVNVENSSYGLTICAERTAAASAIAAGVRRFQAIAVASTGAASPCGACRQFLSEWGTELLVLLVDTETDEVKQHATIAELLPCTFRLGAASSPPSCGSQ